MNQATNTNQLALINQALNLIADKFAQHNKALLDAQARIINLESQVLKLEAKVFNQYTVKLPK